MRVHRPARPAVLIGCLVATSLTACGTQSDRSAVRTTTERFYAAVRHHDGRAACTQLSSSTRQQLVKDQSSPCADAVLQLKLQGTTAATARVYGTSAEVRLAGGDTVFLGDTRAGWRIEAVGCRHKDNGPFDCEEQS